MKNIKYILIAVLLIAIIGIFYAYREFHRGHKDLSEVKSDIVIGANDLVNAFDKDEASANKTYLDKAVSVKGKVASIDKDEKGLYTILLGTDIEDKNISCEMDIKHNEEASSVQVGNEIVMKGVCTGALIDVVMVRCVIDK
jgi:hypothetical protein